MDKDSRELPPPLASVRTLPYGSYGVRVVHLQQRDSAHGIGSTKEAADAQAQRVFDNIPHAVLHITGRTYVIDDAQQFRVGDTRVGSLEMFTDYELMVSRPAASAAMIPEDRVQGAEIQYVLRTSGNRQ